MTDDLYETLGVTKEADEKAIRSGYRKAAKKAHPDSGGSAEAFAKVSRALAILTNPQTRERYDRTGQAEPAGPDTEEGDIANFVMQAILYAVGQCPDVRFSDLAGVATTHINGKIGEVEQQIAQHRRDAKSTVDRFEAVLKRFRKKGGDDRDMVGEMLAAQIVATNRSLESNLAQLEPLQRKLKAAKARMADYEYAFDNKQTDPDAFARAARLQTQNAFMAAWQDAPSIFRR